jgi:hypothetical protein
MLGSGTSIKNKITKAKRFIKSIWDIFNKKWDSSNKNWDA